MPEKNEKETTPASAEDVLGALSATLGAVKGLEGALPGADWHGPGKWEAREKAREERETKEYDSVQAHRKAIEVQNAESHLEHKRANDLHEMWNKASEVEREELREYRRLMIQEVQKQSKAMESIAEGLANLAKK